MKINISKLYNIIEELVHDTERELDIKPLCIEDHRFLINSTASFITDNIYKYLCGVKEHGDTFLVDVDHVAELRKELLDSWNYLAAIQYKMHKHDQRYQTKTKCISQSKQ